MSAPTTRRVTPTGFRLLPADVDRDTWLSLVPLSNGGFAVVDAADYPLVAAYRWVRWEKRTRRYAQANAWIGNRRTTIRMHGLIEGPGADHRNGDGLDNRRRNLRPATNSQNGANRAKSKGSSRFKGVSWITARQKWKASYRLHGVDHYLGLFESEEEAAHAYDRAARDAFGEFARLNFPEAS